MVTVWLLIDTIAMIGSPATRGAAASVVCSGRAWRGAASAGGAAVSAVRAAVAASVTIAGGAHRRTTSADWAVVHRFVMPCPHSRPKRAFSHLLVALPANLVQLCGREFHAPPAQPKRAENRTASCCERGSREHEGGSNLLSSSLHRLIHRRARSRANFPSRPRLSSSW